MSGQSNDRPLTGRTVVVTGASRGLGREMCIALGARGASVVAAARSLDTCIPGPTSEPTSRQGTLAETVTAAKAAGGQVMAVATDLRHPDAVSRLFERADSAFGGVDVLVNNAGLMIGDIAFEDTDPEVWQTVLDTNLRGPYLCCREAVPRMLARGGGVIVNITSGAAVRAGFLNQPYGVSKAGLDRLTLGLATEFRDRNIACIGLSPSVSDTETVRRMYPDRDVTAFARPADWPALALCALLEDDPMRYSGQVLSVREYLLDHGLI